MELYNNCDRDVFLRFMRLVRQYGFWKNPKDIKPFLQDVAEAGIDAGAVKYVEGKARPVSDLVNEMISGDPFLILFVDRPSDISEAETVIAYMGAESIEAYQNDDAGRTKSAYFIVLFNIYREVPGPELFGKPGPVQYESYFRFHLIETRFGFPLQSTLDEDCPYIPPTYCLKGV